MKVPAVVQITCSMMALIATLGPLIHSHRDKLTRRVPVKTLGGSLIFHTPIQSPAR